MDSGTLPGASEVPKLGRNASILIPRELRHPKAVREMHLKVDLTQQRLDSPKALKEKRLGENTVMDDPRVFRDVLLQEYVRGESFVAPPQPTPIERLAQIGAPPVPKYGDQEVGSPKLSLAVSPLRRQSSASPAAAVPP